MTSTAAPDRPRRALRRVVWLVLSALAGIATAVVVYAVLYAPPGVVAARAFADHTPNGVAVRPVGTQEAEVTGHGGAAGMRAALSAIRAAATRHGWYADAIVSNEADPPAYTLTTSKDSTEMAVSPVERVGGSPYTGDGDWTLRLAVDEPAAQASGFIAKGLALALAPLLTGAYAYAWVWVRRVMAAGNKPA